MDSAASPPTPGPSDPPLRAGKEDTFILDFVNEPEEIQEAFQPYYEHTIAGEEVEPHKLYELQDKIIGRHVVHGGDVEEFCRVYYAPGNRSAEKLHPKLYALIDPAVARFGELDEDEQEEYRGVLVAYRNLYSFLSQVISYQDSDLEKLYSYVRFLLKGLPKVDSGPRYDFEDEVTLKYYRLQKISEGAIELTEGRRLAASNTLSFSKHGKSNGLPPSRMQSIRHWMHEAQNVRHLEPNGSTRHSKRSRPS